MEQGNLDNLGQSGFSGELDPHQTTNEPYPLFDLSLKDDILLRNVVGELDEDIDHWKKAPWQLETTDIENINYLLGDQVDQKYLMPHQVRYVDNRLFSSVRAILAYATGQTAKPEILPSKTDERFQRIAKNMEVMLYQHALDHNVNRLMRLAMLNLISRKRGVLKLRYDEDYGPFGDICTDNVDPADIVVGRHAQFGEEPDRIYQKMKDTVEELIEKFPDKEAQILDRFSIVRRTNKQMSRMVTYWECWFSYNDGGDEGEGVCWFIPDSDFILGKMKNPNWIYKGDAKKEKIINVTYEPVKPYIWLNYWNTGRSFIDETCIMDQAVPLQDILNKRGRQIVENADYANPRTLIDKRVMDESDAKKFVNKSPKTIGLVDTTETQNDIAKAVMQIPATMLPSYVLQDKFDMRNEIDEMMGTPTQFRGSNPTQKSPTLGQDQMIKNQASALQDDLVEVADLAWGEYYRKLLQFMKVYLPDDYWVMAKGKDGEYAMITLTDDNIDTNVRLTIQTDSTLPLDKAQQRATAIQLAQIPGRIDDLSLFEMLGLPDAQKLAERVQRYALDRYTYMQSIEQKLYDSEAETDITLLVAGKVPEERDDYSQGYLNHWNLFITTNRFQMLPGEIKQRLVNYLHNVANKAATTQALTDSMLNPAGIIDRPPLPPQPRKTEQIRITGQVAPDQAAQLAGGPTPLTQNPPGAPAPGSSAPSAPRVQPPKGV